MPVCLVDPKVERRAEEPLGEILLGRRVESGEHRAGRASELVRRGGQRLDHARQERRVHAVSRDVGHQDAEPRVVEQGEVVDVAPQRVGRVVAHGQADRTARLGGLGHEAELDLAGEVQLERELRLGGLEQLVALGQLAPQVGDPELGADPGEDFLDFLGRLRLLHVVVGPGVQADAPCSRSPRGS